MSTSISTPTRSGVVYPESDGQPIAENTLQFRWIVTIKENLEALFCDRPDVFIAGDFFWYPVEGDPKIRVAPDVMIVFGRPKGDRRSYLQWAEGGIAPQVIFEILSPGNRTWEMEQKLLFYERYGVQEYYIYDPEMVELSGWLREQDELREITQINGWTSQRLGIRFVLKPSTLEILDPDNHPFLTYLELVEQRDQIAEERDRIARQRDAESLRAERLAAQLRAMGIEPDA
ncbi:MAG TPA: Uma2 family endonuclease [Isosphaeraceae bacterium]|nr:Uma2 family endonuclease [Isosphaeraceae bacterium]